MVDNVHRRTQYFLPQMLFVLSNPRISRSQSRGLDSSPVIPEGGGTRLSCPSWVTGSVLGSVPKMSELTALEFSQT